MLNEDKLKKYFLLQLLLISMLKYYDWQDQTVIKLLKSPYNLLLILKHHYVLLLCIDILITKLGGYILKWN